MMLHLGHDSRCSPTRLGRTQDLILNVKPDKLAVKGPRHFQWQRGGWFGSVVGGSAWMVPTAALLAYNGQATLALIPLGICLLINAVGCALWYRRDRLRPFHALSGILILFLITTPLAWFVVATNATPESLASLNWPSSSIITAMVLMICPTIIVLFCIREYSQIGLPNRTPKDSVKSS